MAKDRYLVFACLILATIAFLFLCYHLAFVQDDAYISFRYAANLLDGNGLVYNAGERVEGFTNFLWVVILAVSKGLLGIDFIITARILSIAAVISIILLFYSLSVRLIERDHFFILLGILILMTANFSIPYWAISGLETVVFAALVLTAVYCEYGYPAFTPAIIVMATLIRPEGALLFGIILLNRCIQGRKFDWRFTIYYIVPLIPFAIFKWLYYGSFLPNPFWAKSGVGLEYIQSGLNYFWFFFSTLGVYGLIYIPPVLAVRRLWRRYSLLYLFLLIYIFYIIWVGGDVLKVYRFFVPVIPVLYLLFVLSLRELIMMQFRRKIAPAVGGAVILLICTGTAAGSYLLSKEHIESYLRLERLLTEKMQFTAGMLKKYMGPDFSVAASTVGILGYELPGHRVIDLLGLTDKYIARHPEKISGLQSTWQERHFNSRYILEQHPDFILFSTNDKPSAPAELALMLHSEFRRCYSLTAFPASKKGNWSLIHKRWKVIDMDRDVTLKSADFALEYKKGCDERSNGNYNKALDAFNSAARLLPDKYSSLESSIGDILCRMGRYDESIPYLQQAAQLDSKNWNAFYMLGMVAAKKGDTVTARNLWYEIYKFAPWVGDRGQ